MNRVAVTCAFAVWTGYCVAAGAPASAPRQGEKPAFVANPAAYVRPIDLGRLNARLKSLPPAGRELVEQYMEAARREVLSPADGVPWTDPRERNRNLAERAKGAAVLSSLASSWPADLRARCQKEAAGYVREVATAHRARLSFGYEWQAAFWAAEAGIAGWFLWDSLDVDTRSAVADMVSFQADRFIDARPKMEYRGNTEAETVSWNSAILTLALNMMPSHPHAQAWDQAAKRFVYNTFAAPQDASNDTPGDDAKPVREWILGANLYPDLALENHNQFHVEYVLAAYRFHMQGAALYWLSGRPLPKAFRHNARAVYERILLPCMTADGFFAFVSDNDWKRYHCWAESSLIHAYLALLEQHPLAAALERRSLTNAMNLWRSFPPDFAYDNPYVCGKAWTSRVADAVLLHLTCPNPLPQPLSPTEADAALQGTSRLETADLLTHYTRDGSYLSSCKGKSGKWVTFVAPREDAWMLLPLAQNYQATAGGAAIIKEPIIHWQRGPDWLWTIHRHKTGRSAEALASLPDGTAVHVRHLDAADLPSNGDVENSIGVEKPHRPTTVYFEGGSATWQPGQSAWSRGDGKQDLAAGERWINLMDRMGFVVCGPSAVGQARIHLPRAGVRDRIVVRAPVTGGTAADLLIVAAPNQDHSATEALARQTRLEVQESVAVCTIGEWVVTVNLGSQKLPPWHVSISRTR